MVESDFEIISDPLFKNFIERRKLSKSTETVYVGRIKSFCEFLGKNPSELIKDAQKGRKINRYFNEYIESLKENGKSSNTIVNRVDTVKAFYNEYDIDTKSINQIISPQQFEKASGKIISQEQIKEALELSNLRDKAIILLHISSGMEATELRSLTYGDFINSLEKYIDLDDGDLFDINKIADELFKTDIMVGTWKIKKHRTQRSYVTFNTSESIKAILSYLIDRERKNKPVKSLKDPLFVNSQNQALNVSAHGSIFKRVNNRANFGYLTKKRRFFSSTMLRKYFKDKLNESGIDESTINAILGQKLDPNINYHSDLEIEHLKNIYLNVSDNLSIEKMVIDNVTSEEYQNLVKKLNKKDKELEEIKKQLNYIKNIIN